MQVTDDMPAHGVCSRHKCREVKRHASRGRWLALVALLVLLSTRVCHSHAARRGEVCLREARRGSIGSQLQHSSTAASHRAPPRCSARARAGEHTPAGAHECEPALSAVEAHVPALAPGLWHTHELPGLVQFLVFSSIQAHSRQVLWNVRHARTVHSHTRAGAARAA